MVDNPICGANSTSSTRYDHGVSDGEGDQVGVEHSPGLSAVVWGIAGPRNLESVHGDDEENHRGKGQGPGGAAAAANSVHEWWLRGWETEIADNGPPVRVIVSKRSSERSPSCRFGVELWQAGEAWVPRRLLVIPERGAITLVSDSDPKVSLELVQRDGRGPKLVGIGFEIENTFWSSKLISADEIDGIELDNEADEYETEPYWEVPTTVFEYAWAELHKWPHVWDDWLLSVPEFPHDRGCEFKATVADAHGDGTHDFHVPVLGFLRAIRALRGCAVEYCLAKLERGDDNPNYTCNLKLDTSCPQYDERQRRRACD